MSYTAAVGPVVYSTKGSMGPAKVQPNDPKNFLKKFQNTAPIEKSEVKHEKRKSNKPPLPPKDLQPVMGVVSKRDYVEENRKDAANAVPKRPPKIEEDFLNKEEYGQVPSYLQSIKAEMEEEKELLRQQRDQKRNKPNVRELTQEEKEEMIKGLQSNWDKINNAYRQLPVTLNTISQKHRKEQYEKQLEAIEKDIEKLSKKHVYVQM